MTLSRQDKDSEALRGALEGDTEMFAELIRRHQRGIIGFCHSMLPHGEGAEDAAQEVFLKALKSLESFRAESSFSTWLYRLAFNHCCNLKKSHARRKTDSLEDLSYSAREKAAGRLDAQPDPVKPELEALPAALARLPAGYRAVIAMRLQGRDYNEISTALGVTLESVRARLRRARLILRRDLKHFLPGTMSHMQGD
ncbi:MAG TPA: RNA polymerase sigma factor [Elusimicrobiales bacterium]|mgnify:CR=1 FL=1|nr:RNA polymerase sigma factor [Elusimicrobiales bacterium]